MLYLAIQIISYCYSITDILCSFESMRRVQPVCLTSTDQKRTLHCCRVVDTVIGATGFFGPVRVRYRLNSKGKASLIKAVPEMKDLIKAIILMHLIKIT